MLFVLSEVFTLVLGPSFDLPCLLATAILDSFSLFYLPNSLIGRCTLGLAFTLGFIFSELPEKPTNLPNLKTRRAKCVFHWYDYLAAIMVPSLGTTDQMLC